MQCVNVKSIPVKADEETTVQTPINNTICWGIDFHVGPDVPDVGSVKDGTLCDKDQVVSYNTDRYLDSMKMRFSREGMELVFPSLTCPISVT